MKLIVKIAAIAALALALPGGAYAQDDYPSEPLKIIVPTDPGGSVDNLARIFQRTIDEMDIYPSVVIVNQPGAGGTIGTRSVKDADPDGYTIGLWHPGIITSNAMGVANYNHAAFTVLGGTGLTELGMGVLDSSDLKTPQDLIDQSMKNPGSITVATNIGLPVHFIPVMFQAEAGIDMKFVQIGGGSKRLASILGGHTDTGLFSVSEFKSYAESGLRPLFLYSEKRDPDLPDIPTAKESGVDISINDFRVWLAPKGVEPEIAAKIVETLKAVLEDADVKEQLAELSINPAWLSTDDVLGRLNDMDERSRPLVEAARAMANSK